jgi:thiamine biosynthesis lipoprotein
MKETRILMGMPITVEIVDSGVVKDDIESVFDYFKFIDQKFSTYKKDSEISLINSNKIKSNDFSPEMNEIFSDAEETSKITSGYFNILTPSGIYDPSGIVKGWAIHNAAKILKTRGFKNFYIDAGGDIQVSGKNSVGEKWKVGIRNPFNTDEIIKILELEDCGIATSGSYIRGDHIYNPNKKGETIKDIVSMTVIGGNVYDADRFATAAFAMGIDGVSFIEKLEGFEGYVIDKNSIATFTSNFKKYIKVN